MSFWKQYHWLWQAAYLPSILGLGARCAGLRRWVVSSRSHPLTMPHKLPIAAASLAMELALSHVGFRTGIAQAPQPELRDTGTQGQWLGAHV